MSKGSKSSRQVTRVLERDLLLAYGPIASGADLYRLLGYRSGAAFRQARRRGRLPVAVFPLEGRKGLFAYTKAIATWLGEQGAKTPMRVGGVHPTKGPVGKQMKRIGQARET